MEATFLPVVSYSIIRYCDTKWLIREEAIYFHNLMLIDSGSCDIYINHTKYHLTCGDIIYCPYGCIRSGENAEPGTKIYAFDFQLMGPDFLPIDTVTHFDNFNALYHNLNSFYYAWMQQKKGYEIACIGFFVLILYYIMYGHNNKTLNPHIKALKHYIIDHSHEALSVSRLAEHFNLNPVYCGSLFKKSEGCTIQEFINEIRINKAKDLLLSDVLSVSDIAYEIGYNDVFYFSKMFKKLTGISPLRYRKQHL